MHFLASLWRHVPELTGLVAVVLVQYQFSRWLIELEAVRQSPALRRSIRVLAVIVSIWVALGMLSMVSSLSRLIPPSPLIYWLRGCSLAWTFGSIGAFVILYFWRRIPTQFRKERRGFLHAAGAAFVTAPFAVVAFGVLVQRRDFHLREVRVPIANLPKDLDGLRIIHMSDLHLSPFLSEKELARAIDIANECRPNLSVITGDLITSSTDPLDLCLKQIARLRSDAGTLACLGNHEIYAGVEEMATELAARLGIPVLRQDSRELRFGNATLNIAGVDYQHIGGGYLEGAERHMRPGSTNILLSHNPDVFDVAAEQGWDLTLSGHTHGGQVNVEILHHSINPARFLTPYTYGLYRRGPSSIWVTRGIGTVGMPARIGAPPEVTLVRLCAI